MSRINPLPIQSARDDDLRQSPSAMRRAAQAARDLAARTGTALIVSRDGLIEQVDPRSVLPTPRVHEPPAGYRKP